MNEATAPNGERHHSEQIEKRIAEKSMILLDDFGMEYTTEAVREAAALFGQYSARPLEDEEILDYAEKTTPDRFYQAYGIATDFPEFAKFWTAYKPTELPPEIRWKHHQPIINPLELFRHVDTINLETILIEATHNLAELEEYDFKSDACYEAVVRAEALSAPLCEILGLDGLAMALRSKATIIRLRNTDRGHFVDEAQRVLLAYEGRTEDGTPLFHHFTTSILGELLGKSEHNPVVGDNARHGIIVSEGICEVPGETSGQERTMRVLARLKTDGSLADKLMRIAGDAENEEYENPETSAIDQSTTPLDMTGLTLVAENDAELAQAYVAMVKGMLASDKITPVAAPSRKQAFHVRGSAEFVATIREKLEHHFPDRQDLFQYKTDDNGFHVAKVTGYFEDRYGCVPFEVQALTAEGRRQSRIGKSGHIFYKLSRQMEKHYEPSEEEIEGLERINERKIYLGTDGLTRASERRINQRLDKMAERAAHGVLAK